MFQHLMEYGYRRTPAQAFGFYIVHLVIIALAGGLTAFLLPDLGLEGYTAFEQGVLIGTIVAMTLCVATGLRIIRLKQAFSAANVVIVLLSATLAWFGGGFLGLIPIAYLTTLPGTTKA